MFDLIDGFISISANTNVQFLPRCPRVSSLSWKESEKYALVRDVIASNGTVHSNDREWQVAMPEINKISTTYRHPSLEDPDEDDVAWFGPPDDEEGTNADVPEDANMAEDAEMDDDGEN
jgi:hypothetical protein